MAVLVNEDLYARVESSLDSIRPYLRKDGGDIELVEITPELEVRVRLVGACETCPMSFMTMKAGVEENLRAAIPEITGIQAVTL
ncbi:MAG: NifU family protein [Bacteroidetes bacterium]|nr:NifU family protein [Bacteroidota bacterium]